MSSIPRLVLQPQQLVVLGAALLLGAVSTTVGQVPTASSTPDDGRWVTVEVPLDVVNEARRRAGRPALQAKAGKETITMRYQQPVERQWGLRDALRRSSAPVSFAPAMSKKTAQASDGITVIEGLDLDDNGSLAGTINIPADPHGAVGTNYVCHVVNVSIQCQTKDGTSVLEESLETFFGQGDDVFDPRVVYDPRADRFIVVVANKVDNGTASDNVSELFLAVSDDGDPSGTWFTQAVDMKQTFSVNGTQTECWFDYPSVALDEEAIYVTGNYFGFESESESREFCDTYLSIFDQGLYSGGQSTRTFHGDPNEDFLQGDFDGVLQPAFIYGSDPGGEIGTWLFMYSGLSNTLGDEAWLVTRVDDPLDSPSFTSNLVDWGDVDDTSTDNIPDAPQPSTTTKIETNDRRALDLVWRDGALWGTTTLLPPSGANSDQSTAFYGEIDLSTLGSPVPASNEYIGGEDVESGAHTYYPSVTVDDDGDAAFAFSLSAPNTYAGSYLVTRPASSGALSSTLLAREGVAEYVRTLEEDQNRWGDYSAVELDPVDGTVWAINKVALSTGSCTTHDGTQECGRWGVYLVQFSSDVLPVELASFEASADGDAAVLRWRTASETNNAGFEIEHRRPTASTWSTIAFVEGAGTTTKPQAYRYRASGLDPGPHRFRLLQTDTDGATAPARTTAVTIRPQGAYALQAPRPNPTAGPSQLRLSVRTEQTVRVSLYNTLGQQVRFLRETPVHPASPLQLRIDGTTLPAGLYFRLYWEQVLRMGVNR